MARSSLFAHVKVRTGHASDLEVSTPLAVLVGTVLGRLKKGRLRVALFLITIKTNLSHLLGKLFYTGQPEI